MIQITLTENGHKNTYDFFRYGVDIPNSLIFKCDSFFKTPIHWFHYLKTNMTFSLSNKTGKCFTNDEIKNLNFNNIDHRINLFDMYTIGMSQIKCKHCKTYDNYILGTMINIGNTDYVSDISYYIIIFSNHKSSIEWLDIIYGQPISPLLSIDETSDELIRKILDHPNYNMEFFSETHKKQIYKDIRIYDIDACYSTITLSGTLHKIHKDETRKFELSAKYREQQKDIK